MRDRIGRVGLFLGVVTGVVATGWIGANVARQVTQDVGGLVRFSDVASKAQLPLVRARARIADRLSELGSSPRPGATGDSGALDQSLAQLRELSSDGASLNALDAAADAIASLMAQDRVGDKDTSEEAIRVRLEALDGASAQIDAARAAEQESVLARTGSQLRRLAYVGGTTGLLAVLGLLVLMRRSDVGAIEETASLRSSMLLESPAVAASIAPAAGSPPQMEPEEPAAPPQGDRRKASELRALASLCTDFARLREPGELPALLGQAARVIEASGFVVWMGDAERTRLLPALVHGYPPKTLARIPAIGRNDDNATALAWREASTQVVRTNGMTPGALVVPILTPEGCVGVLSAEILHGRESSAGVTASAEVIAALLATLVNVPPATSGRMGDSHASAPAEGLAAGA